ncbi:TPA: conjugal transfer protein TraP [Klebsiella oxytoca]
MVKSRTALALSMSSLRWFRWLIQHTVVYPLATMMLLIVTVLWRGHITPGQMLVNTIESVQREGYVIHDCTGPASREALNGDAVKPLLPPVLQEDCSSFSTDAAGYAAHIDQGYTKNILWLWFLMAVVFTGVAVVFGRTPASRTGITWVRDARGECFSRMQTRQRRDITVTGRISETR